METPAQLDLDAPQRRHDLREVLNPRLRLLWAGSSWRTLPNDLPPWAAVHQQTQRWIAAGCLGAMIHHRVASQRVGEGRNASAPMRLNLDDTL